MALERVSFFMKKFIVYISIISLLCSLFPCSRVVYATTTEENNPVLDYVEDIIYKTADCIGAVLDFSQDVKSAFYEYISKTIGKDYTEWLKERLSLNKDGSITISEDLYNILLDFIEENATQKINISDYIFKYYPDKEISTSRVPVANASYDYIMNLTGDEGKSIVDTLTGCKYYWMAFYGGDTTTNSSGSSVSSPIYAYIDSSVENDVVFILNSGTQNCMIPYTYDKAYSTFTLVPMQFIIYPYNKVGWHPTFGSLEVGKYNKTSLSKDTASINEGSYYYNAFGIPDGIYPYYCGLSSSSCDTTGSPYSYYGTTRFPVWVSREKYVEYMTLFPNYNPEQTIINNEDNSVTITNIYNYTTPDDTPQINYSNILEEIRGQVSGILSAFNIFKDILYTKIDKELEWLEKIYDRQWQQYEKLEGIYNKIQSGGGGSTDLSEVLKYLKKINDKLLYNNIVETADAVANWLDLILNDDEDKEASEKAKKVLAKAMEEAFPFSIIFSYEALLVLLEAEPVAPVFEIPVDMSFVNYKGVIKLDFSMFDTAIGVLKWFLFILYIWGLIMLTCKFFNIGGENSRQ